MGHCKRWDARENEVLARARIAASDGPIAGTDQTAKRFIQTVRLRFIEKGPETTEVTDWRYGFRSALSIKQHFSDLSADVQKFRLSFAKVRASNPTGVGDDTVMSMAVAVHIGVTTCMDYSYKEFDKESWLYYRAYNVLKNHPKWSALPDVQLDDTPRMLSSATDDNHSDALDTPLSEHETPEKPRLRTERFMGGSRASKIARQEELRTQAVRLMAESRKRKSDVMEERNAIEIFHDRKRCVCLKRMNSSQQ